MSKSRKNSSYWFGKKHTQEYKDKMSKALSGKNNPMYGLKVPEERKEKIRRSVLTHYKKNGTDNLKGKRLKTTLSLRGHLVSEKTRKLIGKLASKRQVKENNPNWKGGKPKCMDCGKTIHYGRKRCIVCYNKISAKKMVESNQLLPKKERRRISLNARKIQQEMTCPTSIEKKVYDELKRRRFLFEAQKVINNKFIVDVYIPKLNLIIEADGDYWHSLPKAVRKDRAENAYLKKCGYNLVRWREKDINKNVKSLVNKLEGG